MTKEQVIQQKKNEALNKIMNIYHPKYSTFKYSNNYYDESYAEQRDYRIREIIETLEKDLIEVKNKFKTKEAKTVKTN